jgi:hypothetical protein
VARVGSKQGLEERDRGEVFFVRNGRRDNGGNLGVFRERSASGFFLRPRTPQILHRQEQPGEGSQADEREQNTGQNSALEQPAKS